MAGTLTAQVTAIKLATQYLTFEHCMILAPENLCPQKASVIPKVARLTVRNMSLKNIPSIVAMMSFPAFHTPATETSPSVTSLSFQRPDKSHFPIKDISLTNVISNINVNDQTNLTGSSGQVKVSKYLHDQPSSSMTLRFTAKYLAKFEEKRGCSSISIASAYMGGTVLGLFK